MFGSEIFDVAIALVFVYFILSLICSSVTELISKTLAMRSRNLEMAIRNLLNDPKGAGLTKMFYEHPLIAKLTLEGRSFFFPKRVSKPSYISSRSFALAFLDVINPAEGEDKDRAFKDIRNRITKVKDNFLRSLLLSIIEETGEELNKIIERLEKWFDDAMERVSGWYKRKVQLIILCLALIGIGVFNIDTIMIANSIWRNDTLRAVVVAAAIEKTKLPAPIETDIPYTRIKELSTEIQQLELPIGWLKTSDEYEDPRELPTTPKGWIYKVLGLLVTIFAVSQGAPFWFDLLNKLVNLRSTGKIPEKNS